MTASDRWPPGQEHPGPGRAQRILRQLLTCEVASTKRKPRKADLATCSTKPRLPSQTQAESIINDDQDQLLARM